MSIKNNTPDTRLAEMKEAFLSSVKDLWETHQERFEALLHSSVEQTVKLTFTAAIDISESEPNMDVGIGYGQRYTDHRSCTITDPNQMTLEEIGTRPGTGLPDGVETPAVERNGHTDEELDGTPAAFKERHPESDGSAANGESPQKAGKSKGRKKAKSLQNQES